MIDFLIGFVMFVGVPAALIIWVGSMWARGHDTIFILDIVATFAVFVLLLGLFRIATSLGVFYHPWLLHALAQ